ncbi:uncharacterized protein LOC111641434 isoform X1 [Centruroides sculpturatus]|uniref:uncharacterized protein LOC111641434 isoform X1 n=2 Tax=Centruroides sculpturatus TaxID=218467 RepID=UPI000C6CB026|nr:uncharacterized protein LOC111641434 isoform X1 [Centruroides sculpturatus]
MAPLRLFVAICFTLCLPEYVMLLTITRLSVPSLIENGTEDSVILDCQYNYTKEDERLVIKWYLNDDPEPLYQWIPEINQRHVSERLKNRLNLEYMVSQSDRFTKYRAMNIIRPTVELSGKYSCHVSSLLGQDLAEKFMIVYAPAKRFDFNFTKPAPDMLKVTCEAEGIYPKPVMNMYEMITDESKQINDIEIQTSKTENFYNIFISKTFNDDELCQEDTVMFECILTIPGTTYRKQVQLSYFMGDIENFSNRNMLSVFLLALLFIHL